MGKYILICSILGNLLEYTGLGRPDKKRTAQVVQRQDSTRTASTRHAQPPLSPPSSSSPAGKLLTTRMMKLGARPVMLALLVWSCCWTIQVITGIPVGTSPAEMDRDCGLPLTEAELACVPTFGKAAPDDFPTSEGDDIVSLPNKNAYVNKKWPNASAIPYVIDSAFDAKARCAIGYAMTQYHKISCIRFVPRTEQTDYIKINKFDTTSFSCSSLGLGYLKGSGAHHITLSPSCYAFKPGTVIHELMHRIGFAHEHNRPDRDTYVNILWDKIIEKDRRQYEIAEGSSLIYRYDYGSVMHYPLGFQMSTKLNTSGAVIGQREGFSRTDIIKLVLMYCLR